MLTSHPEWVIALQSTVSTPFIRPLAFTAVLIRTAGSTLGRFQVEAQL